MWLTFIVGYKFLLISFFNIKTKNGEEYGSEESVEVCVCGGGGGRCGAVYYTLLSIDE